MREKNELVEQNINWYYVINSNKSYRVINPKKVAESPFFLIIGNPQWLVSSKILAKSRTETTISKVRTGFDIT